MGPTFSLRPLSYVYPEGWPSIREVDFRNLALNVFFKNERRGRYRLRRGRCEIDDHPGHTAVELESVHYLTSRKADRQYALALYFMDSVSGSSSQAGIAEVFELSEGHLQVTQQIVWDLHFGQRWDTLQSFDEKTKMLGFPSAHYLPGDAHCCVSAVDVVTLRWNGERFIKADIHTELSDYGKREGKKL